MDKTRALLAVCRSHVHGEVSADALKHILEPLLAQADGECLAAEIAMNRPANTSADSPVLIAGRKRSASMPDSSIANAGRAAARRAADTGGPGNQRLHSAHDITYKMQKDTKESYEVEFPLELSDLDYSRRLLDATRDAALGIVKSMNESGPAGWDNLRDPEELDVLALLEHLQKNTEAVVSATDFEPADWTDLCESLIQFRFGSSHQLGRVWPQTVRQGIDPHAFPPTVLPEGLRSLLEALDQLQALCAVANRVLGISGRWMSFNAVQLRQLLRYHVQQDPEPELSAVFSRGELDDSAQSPNLQGMLSERNYQDSNAAVGLDDSVESPVSRSNRFGLKRMVQVLSDGSRYEGELRDGRPHGRGSMTTEEGNIYVGEFKAGLRHGRGVLKAGEYTYEGNFRLDAFEGFGVMQWLDGMVYEGHWSKGKRHGFGSLTLPDGSTYDGDWSENVMQGKGKMSFAAGGSYTGEFVGDKMHGHGKLVKADGKMQEGIFVAGEFSGHD